MTTLLPPLAAAAALLGILAVTALVLVRQAGRYDESIDRLRKLRGEAEDEDEP